MRKSETVTWALVVCALLAALASPLPAQAACASDLDGDGICDPSDTDRDGDGVPNSRDLKPNEKDVTPPAVTYDGAFPRTVSAPKVVIEGRAADPGSGVLAPMKLTSNRLPGQEFIVCPDNVGDFDFEPLALVAGKNILTVVTADRAGLKRTDTLEVTFVPPPITINVASPDDGRHVQAQSIAVSGSVFCDEAANGVRVSVGSQSTVAQYLGNRQYSFGFSAVPLRSGLNRIVVNATTSYDARSAAIDVYNDTTPPTADVAAPTLQVLGPTADRPLNEDSVTISGIARDDVGVASVQVGGQSALLFGADAREQRFERWIDLSGEPDGPLAITVRVLDGAGHATENVLQLSRDAHGPVLEIEEPAVAGGTVIHTTSNPLTVRGIVEDRALAGLEVDGRPVALTEMPDGRFRFQAEVALPPAQDQPVRVAAWDSAGTITEAVFTARLDAEARIAVVEPAEDADLMVPEDAPQLPVVALAYDLVDGAEVRAEMAGRIVTMVRDGASLNATLGVAGLSGFQELRIIATHEGRTLATTTRRFRLTDASAIALEVTRFEPDNGSVGVETNSPVTVHLSKPVAPGSLTFDVRETAHGFAYSAEQPGARIPVNRDQLRMPGAITVLPDGRSATFYPQREFAYGGQVQVSVLHGDEEIGRGAFAMRALPTLVQGGVTDQFGEPVAGMTVELPSLGLKTTTNADGVYEFGYGDLKDAVVATGRQRLVVNPRMGNPRFGSRELWIAVEAAALNRIERASVPLLNPQVPFVHVAGGQGRVELAGGGLVLDLSQAELLFPGLEREGAVHVQFADLTQLGVEALPAAMPLWAFTTQPQDVAVSGPVSIEITPPLLYGSRSYLPAEGQLALLVGLDREHRVLEPVGVARMTAGRLVSAGSVQIEALDYVGVRLVEPDQQGLLQQYASEQVSLAQLARGLGL